MCRGPVKPGALALKLQKVFTVPNRGGSRGKPNHGLEAKITHHQRHLTAEGAEIAQKSMFFVYRQTHNTQTVRSVGSCLFLLQRRVRPFLLRCSWGTGCLLREDRHLFCWVRQKEASPYFPTLHNQCDLRFTQPLTP